MTTTVTAEIAARAARVRLVLLDVDGTLTDGGLYYFDQGGLALRFHVRDGLGMALGRRAGLLVGLVSGRDVMQVRHRAAELNLDEVVLGVTDKRAVVLEIMERRGLAPEEVAFVGDDLVDIPAMAAVGFPAAVADAMDDVREAAVWVTPHGGGQGAVRDVIDLVLKARAAARP